MFQYKYIHVYIKNKIPSFMPMLYSFSSPQMFSDLPGYKAQRLFLLSDVTQLKCTELSEELE